MTLEGNFAFVLKDRQVFPRSQIYDRLQEGGEALPGGSEMLTPHLASHTWDLHRRFLRVKRPTGEARSTRSPAAGGRVG